MTNVFKGLIKCLNCGKNYKFKMLRKKPCYICSGFSNYGKEFCTSYFVEEEEIIHTITRHMEIKGEKIVKPIQEYVKRIEVIGEGYKVIYKNGEESLINIPNENGMLTVKF